MTTDTDIINRALAAAVTRSTVANRQERSAEARQANLIYDGIRDACLRMADWGFARKSAPLALLKTASGAWVPGQPPPPWKYEYAAPADFVKARKVLPQTMTGLGEGAVSPIGFLVANDDDGTGNPITVILTNEQAAFLVYTARIMNPALFDPLFEEAFVLWLGSKLAGALSGDKAREKELYEQANALFVTAGNVAHREAAAIDNVAADVSLCNRALLAAGAEPISSFADGTKSSNAAAMFYTPMRDQLLRAVEWAFTRKVLTLSLLKAATGSAWTNAQPQPPWQYEYAYPADCLKLRKILPAVFATGDGSDAPAIGFLVANDTISAIEKTVILTDQQSAIAVYTRQVADPTLFDPLFAEVLVLWLTEKFLQALSEEKGQDKAATIKAVTEQAQALLEIAGQITTAGEGVAIDGTAADVQVANRAILAVGGRPITSFRDGTVEATLSAALYASTRDQMLRAAHWNFARKTNYLKMLKFAPGTPEAALAGDTLTRWNPQYHPALPWLYSYCYPPDCLAVRFVMPSMVSNALIGGVPMFSVPSDIPVPALIAPAQKFQVATDYDGLNQPQTVILCNQECAIAVYTERIINPLLWDSLFSEAMVAALASRLAVPLTKDKALRQQNIAAAMDALTQARARDGNEGLTFEEHIPDWIRVRGFAGDWSTTSSPMSWTTPSFLMV